MFPSHDRWGVPGILNGTYTITAYADVTSTIAEDGIAKTQEISAQTSIDIRCFGFDDAGIGINIENGDDR